MHSAIIRPGPAGREFAYRLVDSAPEGSVVKIEPPRRTIPQNDRMWAMLTAISAAKPDGRELTPDVWKALLLTVAQMNDLMTLMEEYAARHGIELEKPR